MNAKPVALTFADFSRMCSQAEALRKPLPCYVQFRKRGEVLCGMVLDAAPGQGGSTVDFFQLRSDIGVSWCAHHNVRACAGVDGRCACSADDAEPAARSAAGGVASAAPLGNTGEHGGRSMTKGTVVEARAVADGRRIRWTLEQLEQETQQKVRIDWLRFTLPLDAIVRCDRELMAEITPEALADERTRNLVRECRGANAELDYTGAMAVAKSAAASVVDLLGVFEVGQVEDKGLDYYAARCSLVYEGKVVGLCLAGGKSSQQAATVHVNLFGAACLELSPAKWALVRDWVASSSGWLTRVDLACDVWTGEDVSTLPQLYRDGAFDVRGHRPKDGCAGSWASGHSRTFNVGKRETGKCLRAYEKGDELFGPEEDDPWVRYEVELRNNSRVLDLDVLTRPADFFAGAYEFCAELLMRLNVEAEAQRIPAGQKLRDATAEGAVTRGVKWFRRVGAPFMCSLLVNGGDTLDAIVQSEAHRLPGRLRGFSLSALREAFEKVAAGFAPPGAPSINGA